MAVSTGPVITSPAVQAAPNLLTSEQRLIATVLEIPSNMLRTGAALTLQANYARYIVYLDSCQKLADIKKASTWPVELKVPTTMDIVLLFIGKSAWYESWSKTFPNVTKHPDMVKWLKSDTDRKSDLEIWGVVHNVYNFSHLTTWLGNGGTLVVEKKSKKGKEKEKVSHKGGSSKAGRK